MFGEIIMVNQDFRADLRTFCNVVIQRVRLKWDIVIAVTGEEGVGKTTLAIELAKLTDKNFDFKRNIAYLPTHQEIEDKFMSLDKFQTFIIDEAITVLYKQRWADKLQQRIKRMYSTKRFHNIITVMCMPRFTDFTEQIRNHRIKVWFHVIDRGVVVAFYKDDVNLFESDATWHLKENSMIIKNFMKKRRAGFLTLHEKLALFRKTNNFVFYSVFDPLSEQDQLTYDTLKTRYSAEEEDLDVLDPKGAAATKQRNKLIKWMFDNCYIKDDNDFTKIPEQEIADSLNLKKSTILRIIREDRDKQSKMEEVAEIIKPKTNNFIYS